MEEEKKIEGTTEDTKTEGTKKEGQTPPIITRSMMEESCPSCGVETEPKIPAVLPDPSWSTEKLVEAIKDENMLVRSNAILILWRSPSEALEPPHRGRRMTSTSSINATVAIAFGQQGYREDDPALDDPNRCARECASDF
jgi:hypothetical protein